MENIFLKQTFVSFELLFFICVSAVFGVWPQLNSENRTKVVLELKRLTAWDLIWLQYRDGKKL